MFLLCFLISPCLFPVFPLYFPCIFRIFSLIFAIYWLAYGCLASLLQMDVTRDLAGFEMVPHTDSGNRWVSTLIYLPRSSDR
jgi:hypothetical protein